MLARRSRRHIHRLNTNNSRQLVNVPRRHRRLRRHIPNHNFIISNQDTSRSRRAFRHHVKDALYGFSIDNNPYFLRIHKINVHNNGKAYKIRPLNPSCRLRLHSNHLHLLKVSHPRLLMRHSNLIPVTHLSHINNNVPTQILLQQLLDLCQDEASQSHRSHLTNSPRRFFSMLTRLEFKRNTLRRKRRLPLSRNSSHKSQLRLRNYNGLLLYVRVGLNRSPTPNMLRYRFLRSQTRLFTQPAPNNPRIRSGEGNLQYNSSLQFRHYLNSISSRSHYIQVNLTNHNLQLHIAHNDRH